MKAKLPHIDADLIRAALALISVNDDPRMLTKVVHINNQYIEATNGHALIRMKHNAEFDQDIAVQFVYSVPDEAEFLDINSHDDGSHTVTYYRQDRDEEFRPFEKSELVLMQEHYPDLTPLLTKTFKEVKSPLLEDTSDKQLISLNSVTKPEFKGEKNHLTPEQHTSVSNGTLNVPNSKQLRAELVKIDDELIQINNRMGELTKTRQCKSEMYELVVKLEGLMEVGNDNT